MKKDRNYDIIFRLGRGSTTGDKTENGIDELGESTLFWRLALLFVLLPTAELFILWIFSSMFGIFGPLMTLILILGTGILGAALVRFQGLRYWAEFNRQLDRGEAPTQTILHGVLILIGAVFLILPGLISDLAGLLLMVPLIRALVINYAQLRFEAYRARTRHKPSAPSSPDIIDIQ